MKQVIFSSNKNLYLYSYLDDDYSLNLIEDGEYAGDDIRVSHLVVDFIRAYHCPMHFCINGVEKVTINTVEI